MRRPMTLLAITLLLAAAAFAESTPVMLDGGYVWDQGGASGDLRAVFTPTGDGTWDVAFHFTFRGEPHTYTGSASGSLKDGALTGEVRNESGRRTWTFEGTFVEGAFGGVHEETTSGRETKTGTLTLGG